MAKDTSIAWTDHTFNPVRGCRYAELPDGSPSPACEQGPGCYAESMSKRNPGTLGEWGPSGARVFGGESYWRQPVRWNADAEKAGQRRKVFCASLADLFEGTDEDGVESRTEIRPDYLPMLARLFGVMRATPWLDWQLLTKRPWHAARYSGRVHWPPNAWIGTTVENQATANDRIPWLLAVPAPVRFLSMEPLFGCVKLSGMDVEGHPASDRITAGGYNIGAYWINVLTGRNSDMGRPCPDVNRVSWVIVGGQSGAGAADIDIDAVSDIVRQCGEFSVSVFVKQLGSAWAKANGSATRAGTDPGEWPEALRVQEFPHVA